MRIFTFWEPRDSMPGYLKLCMKTWEKYIPDAEIVLLDYSNLKKWIDIEEFGKELLDGRFSLPQIADAIRVMLLERFGGIWMDTDTIILNDKFVNYLKCNKEIAFFGYPDIRSVHIAWISSSQDSKVMKEWLKYQKKVISNFKEENDFWAYLGNKFITPYCQTHVENIEIYDVNSERCMPELSIEVGTHFEKYRHFYFESNHNYKDLKTKSLLMLHNSWTPERYKIMTEDEFLNSDCTLANILSNVLK